MSNLKKYEVIADFKDLQDKDKLYQKGDIYPNPVNKKVSKERIKELSSSDNKIGKPLIKEIKEEQE